MKKTLYIAADHAGYLLKEKLKKILLAKKIDFVDLGAKKLNPEDDYPDFAFALAQGVAKGHANGVLICGSSLGVCIAANKVKNIRAVSASTVKEVKLSREHNDANVLCLSGWNLPANKAFDLVKTFLATPVSKAPRHSRRIAKISKFEKKHFK